METMTPTGGFLSDPAEALNPPASAGGLLRQACLAEHRPDQPAGEHLLRHGRRGASIGRLLR